MRIPTIMQTLKDAGYLTGIFSKVDHSTLYVGFVWDLKVRSIDTCNGRDPACYHDHAVRFIERAQAEGRPFYLMANSEDPHRPFDGAEHGKKRLLSCDFPAPILYSRKSAPLICRFTSGSFHHSSKTCSNDVL